MSLRFLLFVFDVNRVNKDFECKKVGSKFFLWPQEWKYSP